MTKLEQAIAYFEDAIRESDEIIAECSEALQKELMEQKKHFEVALEAMKRQKGTLKCARNIIDAIEEIKDNLHAINCVREMPDKVEMYANEAISIIDENGL